MSSVVNNISEKIQDEYSSSREKIKSNYIDEKYNTISRYKNKTRDCDIDKSFNFEYGNLKDNQTLSRNMSPLNHSQKDFKINKPQYVYTNRDKYYCDDNSNNISKQNINIYSTTNSGTNYNLKTSHISDNKYEISHQYEMLARKEYEDFLEEKLKEFQLTTKNFLFKLNSDPLITSILNNFKSKDDVDQKNEKYCENYFIEKEKILRRVEDLISNSLKSDNEKQLYKCYSYLSELKSKNVLLENTASEMNIKNNNLEEKLTTIFNSYEESNQENEKLIYEIEEKDKNIITLKDRINELKSLYENELSEREKTIKLMKQDNIELLKRIEILEDDRSGHSMVSKHSEIELSRLQKVINVFEINLNDAEEKIRKKQNTIEQLQQELNREKTDNIEIKMKFKFQLEEMKVQKKKIDDLNEEIKILKSNQIQNEHNISKMSMVKQDEIERNFNIKLNKILSEKDLEINEIKGQVSEKDKSIANLKQQFELAKETFSKSSQQMQNEIVATVKDWELKYEKLKQNYEKELLKSRQEYELNYLKTLQQSKMDKENLLKEVDILGQKLNKNSDVKLIRKDEHESILKKSLFELECKLSSEYNKKEEELKNQLEKKLTSLDFEKKNEFSFLIENYQKTISKLESTDTEKNNLINDLNSKMSNLNNQINIMVTEITEKENLLKLLNTEREMNLQSKKENDVLEEKLVNISEYLQIKEHECNLMRKENEENVGLIKTLKNSLKQSEEIKKTEIKILDDKKDNIIKEKEFIIENQQMQINDMNKRMTYLEKQRDNTKSEFEEYKKSNSNLIVEIQRKFNLKLDNYEEFIKSLEKDNEFLINKLNNLENENKNLNDEKDKLNNEKELLKIKFLKFNETTSVILKEVKRLKEENLSLREFYIVEKKEFNTKIQENIISINDFINKIIEKNNNKHLEELTNLEKSMKSYYLDAIENIINESNSKINELKSDLYSKLNEIDTLRMENSKINLKHNQALNEMSTINCQINKIGDENSGLKQEITVLKEKLFSDEKENRSKLEKLKEEFSNKSNTLKTKFMNRINDIISELNNILDKVKLLSLVNDELVLVKKENLDMIRIIKELNNNLDSFNSQYINLKNETAMTKNKLSIQMENTENLNQKNQFLEGYNKELRDKLEILESNLIECQRKVKLENQNYQNQEKTIEIERRELNYLRSDLEKCNENLLKVSTNLEKESQKVISLKRELNSKEDLISKLKKEYEKLLKSKDKRNLELQMIVNESINKFDNKNLNIAEKLDDDIKSLMKKLKMEENER